VTSRYWTSFRLTVTNLTLKLEQLHLLFINTFSRKCEPNVGILPRWKSSVTLASYNSSVMPRRIFRLIFVLSFCKYEESESWVLIFFLFFAGRLLRGGITDASRAVTRNKCFQTCEESCGLFPFFSLPSAGGTPRFSRNFILLGSNLCCMRNCCAISVFRRGYVFRYFIRSAMPFGPPSGQCKHTSTMEAFSHQVRRLNQVLR